jgi:predicted deacylase
MARRTSFEIPVATLANGHRLTLHVHEVAADADGPTLLVVAGVMGDQPTGIETARRAVLALEVGEVLRRGRVRVLTVANPYAYQQHARSTPLDQSNLNRVFPGRADGIFSEQLAAAISENLLGEADVLLAMHSGGTFETTRYVYSFGDLDLARAFGTELVLPGPSYPGTLALAARAAGLRVVVSELGGHSRTAEAIELGLRGIVNLLRRLELVDGEVEAAARQLYCPDIRVLRPRNGGILLSAATADALGREVPGGFELGRVVSPYTFDELERLSAPFERSILALAREPVTHVEAGDYGFIVADGTTARLLTEAA